MSEPPGAAVSLVSAPPAEETVEASSEPRTARSAAAEPPGNDTAPRPPAAQRVLPLRTPGRWIATAVVLVLVAQVAHGLVTNPFYQWDRFAYWFLRPTSWTAC